MKKKYEIFGRKVSVLAIVMAILIIGTASAAIISNYATLTGTVTVTDEIYIHNHAGLIPFGTSVTLVDGDILEIGIAETFTIHNDDTTIVTLQLNGIIEPVETDGPNTYGLSITYSGTDVTTDATTGITTVEVPGGDGTNPGSVIVSVTLNALPNMEPGSYTVAVEVVPPEQVT